MKPTSEDYKRLDDGLAQIGMAELKQRVYEQEQENTEPLKTSEESDTGEIARLAQMPTMDYDRCREEEAKRLGVRVTTLDDEVKKHRPRQESELETGSNIFMEDPDPWPDLVDGAALLGELETIIEKYVKLPTGGGVAVSLWTLFTYVHDAFYCSPIAAIQSPEKRCGKSTLLNNLLGNLCHKALPTSNITPAALFRSIDKWMPTLLVDEADSFLKDNEELRGILNSGHTRSGAYVIRTVGEEHEPRTFRTWAPTAIALIGTLPPTLEDRSIVIPMRRKMPDEKVERLRLDRLDYFQEIVRKCLKWSLDNLEKLKAADPGIPSSLHDRAADNWRPLLAIAELAGAEWLQRAREAAETLSANIEDDSARIQLLTDIYSIFESEKVDRMTSKDLVEKLVEKEDRPWPEWNKGKAITVRQVAKLLTPFKIKPSVIRFGGITARGYDLHAFQDAFSRYLSVTTKQVNNINNLYDISSVTEGGDVTDGKSYNSLINNNCYVVTDRKVENGQGGEDPLFVEDILDNEVSSVGNIEGKDSRRRTGSSAGADNRSLF